MSVDDFEMNSSWSEVSLGSDQTQEGHLQFRRGSRSASEWESVCEERNQTSRNQDTEDEKGKSLTLQNSQLANH